MNIKSEELLNIHLPRWDEFPPFELYVDQVIGFINEHLEVFSQNKEEPIITQAMINNYVKNGALHPPVKKRYNRDHLAKLVVICIGKRVLSLLDISQSISAMMRVFQIEEGYNIFCDEIEYEILSTVAPDEYPPRTIVSAPSREVATMRSLASAVSRVLVFDRLAGQRRRLGELTSKLLKSE